MATVRDAKGSGVTYFFLSGVASVTPFFLTTLGEITVGHDIYGWKVNDSDEREKIYAKYCNERCDRDQWLAGYEKYREETQCAYLRRSAFDDFNATIYRALDSMDCYAGCSGTGSERTYTVNQIDDALKRLGAMLETPPPKREANMADQLDAVIGSLGFTETHKGGTDPEEDLTDEIRFLQACRKHAAQFGSVRVLFG